MSDNNEIRILCIDGGGIRGLLPLQFLKMLKEKHNCYPADCFDVICGTSTGGILALAIGILRMPLEKLSEFYMTLPGDIFTGGTLRQTFQLLRNNARFDASKLEESLKKVCKNMKLIPGDKKIVMVVAHNTSNLDNPTVFCNFDAQLSIDTKCNIPVWQAARATSAAPTFFKPVEINLNGVDYEFQDAGVIGYNNPSELCLNIVEMLKGTDIKIKLVSLSTGTCYFQPPNNRNLPGILDLLKTTATNVNSVHERMIGRLGSSYTRVDFPGFGNVRLDENSEDVLKALIIQGENEIRKKYLSLLEELKPLPQQSSSYLWLNLHFFEINYSIKQTSTELGFGESPNKEKCPKNLLVDIRGNNRLWKEWRDWLDEKLFELNKKDSVKLVLTGRAPLSMLTYFGMKTSWDFNRSIQMVFPKDPKGFNNLSTCDFLTSSDSKQLLFSTTKTLSRKKSGWLIIFVTLDVKHSIESRLNKIASLLPNGDTIRATLRIAPKKKKIELYPDNAAQIFRDIKKAFPTSSENTIIICTGPLPLAFMIGRLIKPNMHSPLMLLEWVSTCYQVAYSTKEVLMPEKRRKH